MALPGLGRRGGCRAARLLGSLATPSAEGWFLNVFLIFFQVGLLKQSTDRMADVAGGLIAPLPFLQRSVVAGIWMRSCVLGSLPRCGCVPAQARLRGSPAACSGVTPWGPPQRALQPSQIQWARSGTGCDASGRTSSSSELGMQSQAPDVNSIYLFQNRITGVGNHDFSVCKLLKIFSYSVNLSPSLLCVLSIIT